MCGDLPFNESSSLDNNCLKFSMHNVATFGYVLHFDTKSKGSQLYYSVLLASV